MLFSRRQVDPSPADPAVVAVAVGDDTIRLWNAAAAAAADGGGGPARWECGVLWKGLQAKVGHARQRMPCSCVCVRVIPRLRRNSPH